MEKNTFTHVMQVLGFDEKMQKVYRALLEKQRASVRTLAEDTGIGRGTVYTILKTLCERSLVTLGKKGNLTYFTTEDPEKLLMIFDEQRQAIAEAKEHFESVLPELKELYGSEQRRPNVSYFTGLSGIRSVLEDILHSLKSNDIVRLYSSEELRGIIYEAFPKYTEQRIDKGIQAKVIKLGGNGVLRGLDEAKQIAVDKPLRTYTHIYGNKVSYITSRSSGYIMAVIIEDTHIARTQEFLFEQLWEYLPAALDIKKLEEDF